MRLQVREKCCAGFCVLFARWVGIYPRSVRLHLLDEPLVASIPGPDHTAPTPMAGLAGVHPVPGFCAAHAAAATVGALSPLNIRTTSEGTRKTPR